MADTAGIADVAVEAEAAGTAGAVEAEIANTAGAAVAEIANTAEGLQMWP